MLRVGISVISLLALVVVSRAAEFLPAEGGENHAVVRALPSVNGTSVLLGISQRDVARQGQDGKRVSVFNLWLAGCSLDGKCLWSRPLHLPEGVQISDLSYFDSICLVGRDGQLTIMLPTDKENLYEMQCVSILDKGNDAKTTKSRFRLPAGYRFGYGGRGSGGIYGSPSEGYYAIGLGLDGKSVIGLKGKAVDELTVQFEHKTTQRIDIIGCVDGKGIWEIGDIDQFGGGERRIEGAVIKTGSVPKIIVKGKFGSIVKASGGYLLAANRNPVFPKAEYVVYAISSELDWISTHVAQNVEVASPFSVNISPGTASDPVICILGAGGLINLQTAKIDGDLIVTANYGEFKRKGVEFVKGVIFNKETGAMSLIANSREFQRENGRVVSVHNVIAIIDK